MLPKDIIRPTLVSVGCALCLAIILIFPIWFDVGLFNRIFSTGIALFVTGVIGVIDWLRRLYVHGGK